MDEMSVVKVDGTCITCGHDHDSLPCPPECAGCGCRIDNGEINPACEVCVRFCEWQQEPVEA
jgi:hypothetical protein